MEKFKLLSKFKPTGDQPQAIKKIVKNILEKKQHQTLLGVTGSGKTYALACAIEKLNRPVLVISHNKTLASQLYAEFKGFFPNNGVEYFVSYYDYYQPESYIPQTDTYIEKDASINEKLDRLRLSSTSSLALRRDVLVVASVSAIYNLGSPQDYQNLTVSLKVGENTSLEEVLKKLISIQYERNDIDFKRSTFRVRGDTVDIFPAYKEIAYRIEFFADSIEKIYEINPITGKRGNSFTTLGIYPAKHFMIEEGKINSAITTITAELGERLKELNSQGKMLEAERLKRRTLYDAEMLKECGYCCGIENYSRHLSNRPGGSRPFCLLDYFPSDFITIVDESHVTIPQIRGMFAGDKSRKQTLVDFGFRLRSCLDNRPLKFDEFMELTKQIVFVSATPSDFEIGLSKNDVIEQIIRPTGILDPEIKVRKTENQIDDLIKEIKLRIKNKERTLVTTLTKRMSEDLSQYLKEAGIKTTYMHSEINTLQRTQILKDLRLKKFDCLVGINLLREGLDLPEVSLIAILDADKEGFLRSATSLIQTAGRCARNVNGLVLMYADTITKSMDKAIKISRRRRDLQLKYNEANNITPKSITKSINEGIEMHLRQEDSIEQRLDFNDSAIELRNIVAQLEKDMYIAAKNLHFERAAQLRDKIKELKELVKSGNYDHS
ncbi:MAG: excinuclease ABC subunit UvrB [Candidatus Omnitrophica bacterium]|nr:excinuclease ABC subunit UvrB [Candidatus Omnitrophota bacterium]